jgi:hypothetical protein
MAHNPRLAGAATLGAALLIGTVLSAPPAHAEPSSFTMTLTEEGPNVVATGSGTINTTGLNLVLDTGFGAAMVPNEADITTARYAPLQRRLGGIDISHGKIKESTKAVPAYCLSNTVSAEV